MRSSYSRAQRLLLSKFTGRVKTSGRTVLAAPSHGHVSPRARARAPIGNATSPGRAPAATTADSRLLLELVTAATS